MFDRLRSREEYDGTGIGLALCRRVAERRDGGSTIDSEPGEESAFAVALPAASEPETEPETTAAADAVTDADAVSTTDE